MAVALCPITWYQNNINWHCHVKIWYCILTKSKWFRCSLQLGSSSVGDTCSLCRSFLQPYTWIRAIIYFWAASEIVHMASIHTNFKEGHVDNNDYWRDRSSCTAGFFCSSSTMSKDVILNVGSRGLFTKVEFHSCIICFWIIENDYHISRPIRHTFFSPKNVT
jgi:hypothetical protein